MKKIQWFLVGMLLILFAPSPATPQVKISELSEATAITSDDLLIIVDSPGGSPVTKKITAANVFSKPLEIGATTPAPGTFTVVKAAKTAGVAGKSILYASNGTDTTGVGFKGPSGTVGTSWYFGTPLTPNNTNVILMYAANGTDGTDLVSIPSYLNVGTLTNGKYFTYTAATNTISATADGGAGGGVALGDSPTWTGTHVFTVSPVTIGNGAISGGVIRLKESSANGTGYMSISGGANLALATKIEIGSSASNETFWLAVGGDNTNAAAIGSDTGVNLFTFQNMSLQAGVLVSSDADGMSAAEMSAVGVRGTRFIATGSGTWILPRAVLGDYLCLIDSGTAHDLILDVTAGSTIRLKGTEGGDGVGITNAAGSSTGDFVCVVAVATDKWSTENMGGSWASQ